MRVSTTPRWPALKPTPGGCRTHRPRTLNSARLRRRTCPGGEGAPGRQDPLRSDPAPGAGAEPSVDGVLLLPGLVDVHTHPAAPSRSTS
ncbi:hypothetical protein EBF04_20275 [Streptomyces sp. I6]|nr:hypothetical protein EBF04_20275 [Streptomyces sp. I6]